MENDIREENSPSRAPSLLVGAVLGALTGLPVVALSYLGSKLAGLPFFPFDLFDWLARVLPGNVITVGIDSMVSFIRLVGLGPISATAKTLEQTMGILMVIVAGAVSGGVIALAIRRTNQTGGTIGAVLGGLAFLFVAAIEVGLKGSLSANAIGPLLWLAILIVGWGALLGGWLAGRELSQVVTPVPAEYAASRRALLFKLAGGSIGLAVAAAGVGRWLEMRQQAIGAGQPLTGLTPPGPANGPVSAAPTADASQMPMPNETAVATLRDRVAPAAGTRPEVTENKDFYRTDIDTLPPVVDKASWKLKINGLFDHPRDLTFADVMAYPAVTQPVTMSCISNPVGGDLISTNSWTGVRLRDVLRDLGLRPQARTLEIKSADGFYENVVMEDMMDPRTLLVYGMNGDTLPVEHGFPLRIYIPNHYGMKQPKWITSIEAVDSFGPGYWVDRGWSATAVPQIVSVIDTVARDRVENGRVPVGGIAWAGDRGIKKVEVQVDGGEWVEAVLRTPPLSALTWVQWRYDWPLVRGTHTFRVRAMDGAGARQKETVQDTYPDGATGYHSITVTI